VPGAKVAKAFNTTFAGTLLEGEVAGQPLDVFVAADDDGAKSAVRQLAADGGLRAIDAGPLALAGNLEALGYLNMAIQPSLGTNYASAIKVVA
jgi:predicted dinucleotide-binding enzyme